MKLPMTNEQIMQEIHRVKGGWLHSVELHNWVTDQGDAIRLFREMKEENCTITYSVDAKQWICSFVTNQYPREYGKRKYITADDFCISICLAYIEWGEENMQSKVTNKKVSAIRDAASKLAGGLGKPLHVLEALVKDVILDLTEADRNGKGNDQHTNHPN